ncbi:acetate--CoA ligase family protein [Streptomyces gilvus]|uniref:acetate--CoA ligase family protein n=1 Tax=Streptomyces gilvus TaxID=2920937 RepID=UPI001F0D98BF|nr:acetate--CoA ligase family protein [Streptomyces sp. CME 23]MCH5675629.1 acetate--CoA ligase family protein [Streptomyces sp. CME 23]
MSASQSGQAPASSDEAMRRLLYPRSIAIFGASDDRTKLSGRPVDHLLRLGFAGRILPINPRRGHVQGLTAYRSLDEIDGDVDLAMIMLPAEQAADAVWACGRRGVPVAIIGASGFAELGDAGEALQRGLRAAVEESGVRVLGPNCLGMIGVRDRAVPTFSSALDGEVTLKDGPVAFLSQSGAFGGFVFNEAQNLGIGISHYLNTGNEVDLSVAELLDGLVRTDQTKVVLAYLEGVTGGRKLLEAAREAHERDKPVIAVKVGRSAAGVRAAQSHTASLAGDDAVFDGAARQYGILRVDGPEPMLDAAQIFATGRRAHGRRLTVLSVSGGAGALMADAAVAHDIEVRPWENDWQRRMAAVIPEYGSARNPIDLTGTLVAQPDILRRALQVAVEHPDTDMIAVLLGCADSYSAPLIEAIEAACASTDRPVAVVWTGGSGRPRQRLRDLGIPCYTDPGRAAAALGLLADHSLRPSLPRPQRPAGTDRAAAVSVLAAARADGRGQLDEHESARLIAAYGVPCAASLPAGSADAAVIAAQEIGGPVAVKLLSDRIGHKSDIGGVRLGLDRADTVREAAQDLLRIARDTGVDDARLLVQRMARAGTELIVGARRDPVFGPVVVVGLGGVLVEALADSRVAVAPIDTDTARRLLLSLRGSRLFEAVRGGPPRDIDAAAEAVARVSWLAADLSEEIAELDVNPLLLGQQGHGVVAVDALVVLTGPAGNK